MYDQCGIDLDTIQIVFICLTLAPLFVIRIYQQNFTFNASAGGTAQRAQQGAMLDSSLKVVFQFSFFLYAEIQWRDCTPECWDNVSILMINYIITQILTLGSGCLLGCFLSCMICCLPCLISAAID